MFIHTRSSGTKRFAKFGRQKTNFFVGKKRKTQLAQPSQTDYTHARSWLIAMGHIE